MKITLIQINIHKIAKNISLPTFFYITIFVNQKIINPIKEEIPPKHENTRKYRKKYLMKMAKSFSNEPKALKSPSKQKRIHSNDQISK